MCRAPSSLGFLRSLRLRELQEELPKLEAEVAHLGVRGLSADEVLNEARNLQERWPALPVEEKRAIVESIAEKVVIGKDSVELVLSHLPSTSELTKTQQLL